MTFTACIGLGANLGDPVDILRRAVADLQQLPDSRLTRLSFAYRSAPLGPPGQPDYINAVATLETRLPPHALLTHLQHIENRHGRTRDVRWGARTLDLDLLLYGNDVIRTTDLTVPHPELGNRNFVVVPLLDVLPDLVLPDGTALRKLAAASDHNGLERLSTGIFAPISDN